MTFVAFPNQCFDERHFRGRGSVIICDDPIFYGDRRGSPYGPAGALQLNPLRNEYQRACVRDLAARISAKIVGSYRDLAGPITAYDPCDKLLEERLKKTGIAYTFLDSPQFLATRQDIHEFPIKNPARPRIMHRVWYNYMKKKLGVLEDTPNLDVYNRKAVTSGLELPEEPTAPAAVPTNPRGARAWFAKFLRERFAAFGPYEDAIVQGRQYLYHSGIAPFLNNGLLTPAEVIAAALEYRDKVPIESLEGFLRQIIGWREYSRLYYLRVPAELARPQELDARPGARRRASQGWYTGAGMPLIVQETIRDAFKYGYLHHIRRLMVMSNYMTLRGVHPDAIYAWMFEFSLDSWEWVMAFNVYSMGTAADGGIAMRKPYLSTTQYLYKISDPATRKSIRADPKSAEWDQLYREHMKK